MTNEILKLALEALEEPKEHFAKHRRLEAITAIKELLAQPEPEYLAFMDKPQRKPLTRQQCLHLDVHPLMTIEQVVRVVEAAHNIKGEA